MSVLHNPPMPDWNNLSNEDRDRIVEYLEYSMCPCCRHRNSTIYEDIREALKEREKRYFRSTMDGP
jgi:hypothetical protein